MIRVLRKKIKNNSAMIKGLEMSYDGLIREALRVGDARAKIRTFADKFNIDWLRDI